MVSASWDLVECKGPSLKLGRKTQETEDDGNLRQRSL